MFNQDYSPDLVYMLIQGGASLNIQDNTGKTAVIYRES